MFHSGLAYNFSAVCWLCLISLVVPSSHLTIDQHPSYSYYTISKLLLTAGLVQTTSRPSTDWQTKPFYFTVPYIVFWAICPDEAAICMMPCINLIVRLDSCMQVKEDKENCPGRFGFVSFLVR